MGLEASGRLFLFEEGLLQSTSTSQRGGKKKIRGGGKGRGHLRRQAHCLRVGQQMGLLRIV